MLSSVNIHHVRPRATTASSQRSVSGEDPPSAASNPRPSHERSRSYLSPVDPKPRNVMSMPVKTESQHDKDNEKRDSTSTQLPRIHLPGHRYRHSHDIREGGPPERPEYRKHRHTQSEAHHVLKAPKSSSDLRSGSGIAQGLANMNDSFLYPGIRGAAIPQLMRMASHRSTRSARAPTNEQQSTLDLLKHRGDYVGSGLRRRATSDPKSPSKDQFGLSPENAQKPMSELDVLIYKSERARQQAATESVTDADVAKLSAQLAESNVELQSRLSSSTRSASEYMRRLEDTHESLLHTASSLIDTISSFHNLNTQSSALISNFEATTGHLDQSVRTQLSRNRESLFSERGTQLTDLERRGKAASERAEALGRRLDNCRIIVQNFEERQLTKRRAWKGVVIGTLWGFFLILLGLLLGFSIWGWRNYGDILKRDINDVVSVVMEEVRDVANTAVGQAAVAGLRKDSVEERIRKRVLDSTSSLNDSQLRQLNVPEDVITLLGDIADRHLHGGTTAEKTSDNSEDQELHKQEAAPKDPHEDKRLRLLDEL